MFDDHALRVFYEIDLYQLIDYGADSVRWNAEEEYWEILIRARDARTDTCVEIAQFFCEMLDYPSYITPDALMRRDDGYYHMCYYPYR